MAARSTSHVERSNMDIHLESYHDYLQQFDARASENAGRAT
jgi:hypothetical protein